MWCHDKRYWCKNPNVACWCCRPGTECICPCNPQKKAKKSQKPTNKTNYKIIVSSIAIGDTFLCVTLLIIAVADSIMKTNHIQMTWLWTESLICYVAGTCQMISNNTSILSIHFMGFSRLYVVKDPIHTNFLKHSFTIGAIILINFSSIFIGITAALHRKH